MTTKERIKSLLLIVLLIGAAFLTYSVWFYDNPTGENMVSDFFGKRVDYQYNDETLINFNFENSVFEVKPLRISFKNDSGRYGLSYDDENVGRLYQKTKAILRESLNTATAPVPCDSKMWMDALENEGVLYDFEGVMPLSVIAVNLASENTASLNIKGRYLLLSAKKIYLKNPYKNEYYMINTALPAAEVTRVLRTMAAPPCALAFESKIAGAWRVAPETIILDAQLSALPINGYNPTLFFKEDEKSTLLKNFGLNYHTCGKYTEQDGTQVYIEGLNMVKIALDGYVTYTDSDKKGESQSGIYVSSATEVPTESEILQTANEIITKLATLTGGSGSLYMQDYSYFKDSKDYVVRYGWSFRGIPIDRQKTGFCAQIVINGKKVKSINFYMRSYEGAGTTVEVLSHKLAIAALTGDTTAWIGLRYTDAGQTGIIPEWYVKRK